MQACENGGGSWPSAVTSTSRAAAATAAAGEAVRFARASYAYGSERRSMALRASWIAMWDIAYMRASWSGSSRGAMQAAMAAFPADAFHAVTAFGCGE